MKCRGREAHGNGMEILHCKLKEARVELKKLNHDEFSNISSRVIEKQVKLEGINGKFFNGDLNPNVLSRADSVNSEYKELCSVERQLFQSKARMSWYKDGDASTNFFHKNMRSQQNINRITQIHNKDGVLVEKYDDVKEVVVNFYKDLFAAKSNAPVSVVDVKNVMKKSIQDTHKHTLGKCVSSLEIEDAMLSMKVGKATGPDTYSAEFYRDAWLVIKDFVVEAIQTFFVTSHMSKFPQLYCYITLIPKVPKPQHMKDFRHIACCNTI
ncbi:hypothetical protein LIER_00736 [Lithospermum erythrorhizon]|uniref:RNA-directed DNA polymerase, eukaryota, reverse transcriptase zinc-binding domain protein n=1 Tax=Lithospermum erythrorhizon TaxID=34254 RepID=A0AAV3NJP0_LITER